MFLTDLALSGTFRCYIDIFVQMDEQLAQQIYDCRKHHYYGFGLTGPRITAFPKEILRLRWLRYLHIYNTSLTDIPEEIADLRRLSKLVISQNPLSTIPDSIGSLHNLLRLNLSQNQLTQLPESLCHLKNLRALYLQNNQLSRLPDSIFLNILRNQPRLKKVHLEGNPIKTISNIKGLDNRQIEQICLRDELLDELPNDVFLVARIVPAGYQPGRILRYAETCVQPDKQRLSFYFSAREYKGFIFRYQRFYIFFYVDQQGLYNTQYGLVPQLYLTTQATPIALSEYGLPAEHWMHLLQLFCSFSMENIGLVDAMLEGFRRRE